MKKYNVLKQRLMEIVMKNLDLSVKIRLIYSLDSAVDRMYGHIVLVLVKTNANLVSEHKNRITRMNISTNQHQSTGTSEYRGSQFCNQKETNKSIKSYSHTVQLDASPVKDQDIIIHAIDDISLQDYALVIIGKLIGSKAIRSLSKRLLTQNSNIVTNSTIPNINSTLSTLTQSSKLPVKKMSTTTKTKIDNIKQTIDKLSIQQSPNLSSSKRPMSQSSADGKPDYVSLNDTDFMPSSINPRKKRLH
ncbi:hypothetical protein WN51_10615 [Melipona quadrifasciata]|uniref:Uncharacterized protein n=1 Tax=Melipona quadrifasciata TaxID=166423 RepID=A0A0M8ZQD2_9HYME|nr:hypothetical protein WN51_10615 [Melipona quadrifasciata]